MGVQLSPLQCPLREWVIKNPEARALILDGQTYSRVQLDHWVESFREALVQQGVKRGEKILFQARDSLETVLLILSCLRSGWVCCPVNPRFPDDQTEGYRNRIRAEWVVASANESLPSSSRSLILPDSGEMSDVGSVRKLENIEIDPEALCDLIATSGTTGVPKAVSHTFSNHFYSAEGSLVCIPLSEDDGWLLSLPLFHVGGYSIVIRCLLAGACMVIDRKKTPLGQLLKTLPVTRLSLVNTQLHRLLKVETINLRDTRLKTILLGGGFASPELAEEVQKQGVEMLTTYGMTEMSSQVCTGEPEFVTGGVTSGHVLPFRQLSINDEGEILVRGKTLSPGYYFEGALLSMADSEGWYHTGDKGVWVEGQLRVTGRKDNMMVSGGENIHPEEIEQALLSISNIVQAVVVSVDDEEFGQRPFAFVQTASGKLDEVFTKQALEGSISRFKIPGEIRPFPAELVQSGLKPDRQRLQKMACELSRSANSYE